MTSNERDAVIKYLEYRLIQFVAAFENTNTDTLLIHEMYKTMFDICDDLENNIITNQMFEMSENGMLKTPKNPLQNDEE